MENTNNLTSEDAALLKEIGAVKRYSLVRFELHSSKDKELRSIALTNVHLTSADESMENVKARGAAVGRLCDGGYVLLDFRPQILVVAEYTVYQESAIYAQLCSLAESGRNRPGFLFDTPYIKKGQALLTQKGKKEILQSNH